MKENLDKEAENIFDTWELYRKIVSFNNMFHREIYADVANVLQTARQDFTLLDLGCGDAANLAPVLMIVDNDFPETLSTLQTFAQQAGFAACHAIGSYKWHKVLRFDH
ncbi:MAG: hypothetical protein PHH59_04935 [Methylovulum sp.]|uniref:hypothetical protein n=1 Tax=Methylovulum sp. TaxID=1916980 RepID=UPI0026285458|nr:hypothetical protein [Methylovulum sp.]MDD2723357.1 hypothetical protein [Methylovulum sp.]MDD5125332.1 hypothetical protein [Methylovulum sp.]